MQYSIKDWINHLKKCYDGHKVELDHKDCLELAEILEKLTQADIPCFICKNNLWYLNLNGEYILCPRCDILRIKMEIYENAGNK